MLGLGDCHAVAGDDDDGRGVLQDEGGVVGRADLDGSRFGLAGRRNLAAELGWIMPPPKKRDRNPDWMVLTATGANRIVEILDRRRKLIWSAQIAISKKRELFPKNLIYTMLPEGKYRKYVQELKAGTELQY